jgi:hypothetical protein
MTHIPGCITAAVQAYSGPGRKLQQATDDFLVDDFNFPNAGPRIEGTGSYGSVIDSLLTRLNTVGRGEWRS